MMGADYKTISYYSEKDRAYIVFAPDLLGCFADGETIKEAQDNIRQVIDEWKESAQELGRKIPEPLTTLETTNATVLDVAKYILTQTGRISTLMLQKLLYYCNAWSLAWFHKPLFSQQFEAWSHGPVCRELFDYHKGKYAISTKDIDSQHQFSALEKSSLITCFLSTKTKILSGAAN